MPRRSIHAVLLVLLCSVSSAKADQANGLEAPPLLGASAIASESGETEHSILRDESTPSEELPEPTAPATPTPAISLPAGQHPWAKFRPGAWRRERVTSEAFDEKGQFLGRSVTDRKVTLVSVIGKEYTLRSETVVELGGKTTPGPTEERTLQLLTDSPAAPTEAIADQPTKISLGGKMTPCLVWRLTTNEGQLVESETVCYSPTLWPHVLRREKSELIDGAPHSEWTVSVERTGAAIPDGSTGIARGWHSSAVRTLENGARTERFTIHGEGIPGGVSSQSTTERDPLGRRVRWTLTQLVAYGDSPQQTKKTASAANPPDTEAPTADEPPRTRLFRRLFRPAEEPLQ